MQSPTIVFDHINKVVSQGGGIDSQRKLAEVAAAQQGQVSAAVGSPPPTK